MFLTSILPLGTKCVISFQALLPLDSACGLGGMEPTQGSIEPTQGSMELTPTLC